LVALAWSFIWAWALYSVDLGHLGTFRERYQVLLIESQFNFPSANLKKNCEMIVTGVTSQSSSDGTERERSRLDMCKKIVEMRHNWAEIAYLNSSQITFPGGFGKLHISDLGIAGQFGLGLILSWVFFAVRRQNHAIRAIVDMDEHSRKNATWRPSIFVLKPQDVTLSAEHVAYAYHSVAQRFVFLFSQHSQPLLLFTMALLFIPALVATWNLYTDIRDTIALGMQVILFFKVLIEIVLVMFAWVLTYLIVRFEIDTSVLLNGWYLAARDVWEDEWDETPEKQKMASSVKVDVAQQRAEKNLERRAGRNS